MSLEVTLSRINSQPVPHGGGSLGLGRLNFDPRSDRIKGFHGQLLTPDTLDTFRGEVSDALSANPRATRLTARALARNSLLPRIREIYNDLTSSGAVEAIIPVDRTHSIVYIGRNTSSRLAPARVQDAQSQILSDSLSAAPVSAAAAFARVRDKYTLETLTPSDLLPHVDSLVELFGQAYPKYLLDIDASAVLDMASGQNIFFAAMHQGRICSVLVAEHGVVQIEGYGPLALRELSEYATHTDHGGNGLMIALQHMALERLGNEQSVVFAEGRAPWAAVIRSMVRAGLVHAGTLNQHCTLVAVRSDNAQYEGDYEDLQVFHSRVLQ
ncbi:MAG: hypothetical protein ACP5N9_00440 [Candidatus Bilamarchaeum sp.]